MVMIWDLMRPMKPTMARSQPGLAAKKACSSSLTGRGTVANAR